MAHNCLLIQAAKDKPAVVWGGPAKTLDGGQYTHDGKQLAFETNDDFTYTAVDMTAAYFPGKCAEAVRQFVFIPPSHFVIFDRVQSRQASQSKIWRMHTATKPEIAADGRTFQAAQTTCRPLCRTILPEDARLAVVGGPGKEYWSPGAKRNFPDGKPKELNGPWRVEVHPGKARVTDHFLHVIRVGDSSVKDIGEVTPLGDKRMAGVSFRTAGREVTLQFSRSGRVGGHIKITGTRNVNRNLAAKVTPQVGLPGESQ